MSSPGNQEDSTNDVVNAFQRSKSGCSKVIFRVSLVDGSKKTLQVGDRHCVRDVCNMVASKLGMQNSDKYSLFSVKAIDGREYCLPDEENPVSLLRKAKTEGHNSFYIFKKRIFLENEEDDDDAARSLIYAQIQQTIFKSDYRVDQTVALKLGALQLQIAFGDYDPTLHISGFLTNRDHILQYVPAHLLKNMKVSVWERLLFENYAQQRGLAVDNAMREYLNICKKEFPFFGATFYPIKARQTGSTNIKKKALFGITGHGVYILREDTRQLTADFKFDQICSWATTSATFAMLVVTPKGAGELADMSKLIFESLYGEEMSFNLQSYVNYLISHSERTSNGTH